LKKFRFFTDGEKTIKVYDGDTPPTGFTPGRTFKSNPWNKGKTKEDCELLAKSSNHMSDVMKGKVPWNKGLTKETSESLMTVSKKVSKAMIGNKPWNKGVPMRESSKKKLSESNKGKKSWCKGLTKETSETVNRISTKMKGHRCFVTDWDKAKEKEYLTRKKNNSFTKSSKEEEFYDNLIKSYGEDNVIRQYFDKERYPFKCDFYIKSEDLFIEYHGTWLHGGHPFDKDNDEDIKKLSSWKEKSCNSDYYKFAVYVWTDLDVRKLKIAKENNLNFKVIYPQ